MKEDDITRYQCSSPIEELCKYDYLIPVGIHLNEKHIHFRKFMQDIRILTRNRSAGKKPKK